MAQETKRTFTQEQAGEMYSFLLRTYGAGLTDYETLYTLRRRAAEILDRIHSAATPDTPPAGTGSGARYVPTVDTSRYETHKEHWRVWDTQEDMPFVGYGKPEYYELGEDCQTECNRLNAAHPASGKRYVVTEYPTKYVPRQWHIVNEITGIAHGEDLYESPDEAQTECDRLNAADTVAGSGKGGE